MAEYSITAHGAATYEDILDRLAELAVEGRDFTLNFPPSLAALTVSGLTLVSEDAKLIQDLESLTEVSIVARR